jgi:hypothetical protein
MVVTKAILKGWKSGFFKFWYIFFAPGSGSAFPWIQENKINADPDTNNWLYEYSYF